MRAEGMIFLVAGVVLVVAAVAMELAPPEPENVSRETPATAAQVDALTDSVAELRRHLSENYKCWPVVVTE